MKVWFVLTGLAVVLVVASGSIAPVAQGAVPRCLGQDATIVGTAATETIRGTSGPDVIVGGGSDFSGDGDEIFGLGGDDLICEPDEAQTFIHGGGGDDQVRASGNMWGGPGNDTLIDILAQGNTVHLVGGTGDDVMRAAANDLTLFVPGDGDDTVVGTRRGWNVLNIRNASGRVVVDLRTGTARGQGDDVLDEINFVFGSEYADVILGNDRWNVLGGFGGDDVLVGGGRFDLLSGGEGDDRVDGGPGNDQVQGDVGRDMLLGRSGNDELAEKRRPEPNMILGGSGRDNCRGGYRVPPNIERGCETHGRPSGKDAKLKGRSQGSAI